MRINLDYYEFKQAIEDYLLKEYKLQISLENSIDFPYLETTELLQPVDGKPNAPKSERLQPAYKRVSVSIDDCSEISIFI